MGSDFIDKVMYGKVVMISACSEHSSIVQYKQRKLWRNAHTNPFLGYGSNASVHGNQCYWYAAHAQITQDSAPVRRHTSQSQGSTWPFTFRHKYAGESGGWQPLQQNTCRGYFLDEGVITPVPSRLTSFTRGWSSKDDHHHKFVVMNRGGQSHMSDDYV